MKNYPDITSLLKTKADHRRSLASLPFEKKIELVFKLKARQRFIKTGRPIAAQPKARQRSKS